MDDISAVTIASCETLLDSLAASMQPHYAAIEFYCEEYRWILLAERTELGRWVGEYPSIDEGLLARKVVDMPIAVRVGAWQVFAGVAFFPIWCRDRLWGRLTLVRSESLADWDSRDVIWIQALLRQLGVAIAGTQIDYLPQKSADLDLAKLQREIEDWEYLHQLQNDFIDRIVHDLRAPMMNIRMATRTIEKTLDRCESLRKIFQEDEKIQKYWQIIDREITREIELISNILDVRKIETVLSSIAIEEIDLNTYLRLTIEPYQERARYSQQHLTIDLPAELPIFRSDRHLLSRIVSELLNNACKYTKSDRQIDFSLRLSENNTDLVDTPSGITLVISNQAEIPETHLPHIFDRFYRAIAADDRHQYGSGLGLAIVRDFVKKLNGTIDAISQSGWTTFTVFLPTFNE
jgi:signal transduction histidine kinase